MGARVQRHIGRGETGNCDGILTALLLFNTYLLEKRFCPEIIRLMSYGESAIEPEIESHTGNALWCAALYGVTDTGLLLFLVFYPLVQQKFLEISEIFFFFFLICLSVLRTT